MAPAGLARTRLADALQCARAPVPQRAASGWRPSLGTWTGGAPAGAPSPAPAQPRALASGRTCCCCCCCCCVTPAPRAGRSGWSCPATLASAATAAAAAAAVHLRPAPLWALLLLCAAATPCAEIMDGWHGTPLGACTACTCCWGSPPKLWLATWSGHRGACRRHLRTPVSWCAAAAAQSRLCWRVCGPRQACPAAVEACTLTRCRCPPAVVVACRRSRRWLKRRHRAPDLPPLLPPAPAAVFHPHVLFVRRQVPGRRKSHARGTVAACCPRRAAQH